jgi:hypothetical protein
VSKQDPHQTNRSLSLGFVLPLAALLLAVPALIYLTGGFFGYLLLVVGGMVVLGMIHWVLWGRALTEEVAAERAQQLLEEEEREEEEEWPISDPYGIRKK